MKKAIARVMSAFFAASLFFQTPTTNITFIDNIKQVEAATTKGTIKSAVNLRKTASNSAKILKVLSKGTSVTITSTSTVGWYKVKVGTVTGYVGRTYVTLTNSSSKTTTSSSKTSSSSSSSSSGTGNVIAAYLNFRKSASNSGKILKVLTYGTKVTIQGTTGSWYKVKVGSTTGYVSKAYIKKTSSSSSSNKTTTTTSSKVTSSSVGNSKTKGQQIVNYALKFVGNKYVYGGTSLTKGADCSGFTMSVYKYFGYNLPRTSAAQRTAGKKVASLSQAQAGDLICYSGHVAIYMGNNKIVHSANPKRGIVSGDAATSMTILAIRRIV